MKKIGSLYVPSGTQVMIKNKETNFSAFMMNLKTQNPISGKKIVSDLLSKITDTVAESFEPHRAPMRNKTDAEVQRRIDICIDYCLSSSGNNSIYKTIDEIPQRLWEALQISDKMKKRSNTWGVREKMTRTDFDAMKEEPNT